MGLRSGDWLGHSRTLMCFFLSHSFVALAVCFGSLSCWNTHPRPIFNALSDFNALALTVHGPVHRPFDEVQLSCPLSRKTPPKHNVSTSMFDGGDGVLGVIGSIPPPPNTASWVDAKELDFGLIWPQHFPQHPVLLWIMANFRRAYTCAFLSRGTLRALQDFSHSWRSVLPIVFLGLWSQLPWDHWQDPPVWFWADSSPFLMIIETPRGEILHGATDRGRLTVILCFFHLRIIAPTVVTF